MHLSADCIRLEEMKRKPVPPTVAVIPKEILEQAKLVLFADRPARLGKCEVCGSECAPNSTENLCWVCRRLKISAWRDVDQQAPAQE